MLGILLLFTVASIWIPQAWIITQYFAPWIIPAAMTLFLGDATADAYLKSKGVR